MRLHKLSTPFLLAKKNPALFNTNDSFQVSPSKSRPIQDLFNLDLVLKKWPRFGGFDARMVYVVVLHTMTQWNRRLVEQKWCPSKHQVVIWPTLLHRKRQVAFGLMQSALLLTGLERSIQNTRALVEKNCWCFPDRSFGGKTHCVDVVLIPRWYFLYFLYLIFGVAKKDTLTNSLAACLQRLLFCKLTAFRGSSLAPCYHGEVSTWELAWGWVLVHCCLAWVLQLHDCRIVRHSQVGMDGWIWIWQSSNLVQDWHCYMDMICVFEYTIIYNIHIIAYTHSFIFMLTHP